MKYSGIGGQAVMEGVMMKNKETYAVAVRKPDGEIEIKKDEFKGISSKGKFFRAPFVRGIVNFIDSLTLGMSTLTYSSSFYEEDEKDKNKTEEEKKKSDTIFNIITIFISVLLAIGIFVAAPFFISSLLEKVIHSRTLIIFIEGIIRLAIFIIYMVLISLIKDIKRVYMYHGAEHKCINCIERGRELTVKNVMASSRLHKRCGTSFMLFVMVISIIAFMFIKVDDPLMRVLVRIVLVPVIAGISYEVIRLAGNNSNNPLVKMISAPGMLLQTLTTKEPTEDMVEVAIKSVEAVFDWREYLKEEFGYGEEASEDTEEDPS